MAVKFKVFQFIFILLILFSTAREAGAFNNFMTVGGYVATVPNPAYNPYWVNNWTYMPPPPPPPQIPPIPRPLPTYFGGYVTTVPNINPYFWGYYPWNYGWH